MKTIVFLATIERYSGPGTTSANEMNFGMNHAPGASLLAGTVTLYLHHYDRYQPALQSHSSY